MNESSSQPIQRWLEQLSERLVLHRLNRNMTQEALARAAGISVRTLARLENGEPTHLENFLRVMVALGLEGGLERMVPDVPESPIQRLERSGRSRQRATGSRTRRSTRSEPWTWGEES